jgi:hypothetical protein
MLVSLYHRMPVAAAGKAGRFIQGLTRVETQPRAAQTPIAAADQA